MQTEDTPTQEQLDSQQLTFANGVLSAINARESEFEKGWWVQAKNADAIYTADKDLKVDDVPYNILYSNTEVLMPSLYSATPKPDIRGRYRNVDVKPIPEVLERFLKVASDPSSPGADTFDSSMRDCVLSALVPGMGYVRLRYVENAAFPIIFESGHYKTLIWGKATRWAKVPWLAFKHTMKRDAMFKQFDIPEEEQSTGYVPSSESEDDKDTCDVFEFWDKKTRKVYFLCDQWNKKLLRTTEDPLGLENFFPTPGLMMMTMRTNKFLPIPLYNYYKNQAEELNRVSIRLNKVLSAIRVKGAYNGLLGDDLKKLLDASMMDNELIAATEAGLLAQSGGFDKHIWLLPIENFIAVATQLYQAREAIKQVIYEITGISDIIRGSSVASETATAQDLKAKWGTVRLRRMQTVVAEYARDLFRMAVDCGSDKLPPQEWAKITQMSEIPTTEQQNLARQQLQHDQMLQQQMAASQPPPVPPQPGQPPQQPPPQPPPPDPKLVSAASSPTWEMILGKVKQDNNRTFIVNIQTSSTIDIDTAQDKSEVNEFMAAMGQLLPGLQGFISLGPTGLDAAKEILAGVCSRYKFGIEIADSIRNIQAPPPPPPEPPKGPPPPTPAELQANEAIAQQKIAKAASDSQVMQAQTQLAMAEIENQKAMLGIAVQEAQLRLQGQRDKLAADKEMASIKLAQARAPKPAPASPQ